MIKDNFDWSLLHSNAGLETLIERIRFVFSLIVSSRLILENVVTCVTCYFSMFTDWIYFTF